MATTESSTRKAGPSWLRLRNGGRSAAFLLLTFIAAACETQPEGATQLPSVEEVAPLFTFVGGRELELSGNVLQVTATVDPATYRMGGTIWLRASPYIFLFSAGTQEALAEYPALGGVRVLTRTPDGTLIASALLRQGTLTSVTWRRALSIAGLARTEGTERPGRMRDLIRWGEDHTEFEYNPELIPEP